MHSVAETMYFLVEAGRNATHIISPTMQYAQSHNTNLLSVTRGVGQSKWQRIGVRTSYDTNESRSVRINLADLRSKYIPAIR
jgi:hypothetical protein